MSESHELAKTYYSAARAEILQRISLREQVLLAGVAALGVIGGWTVSSGDLALLGIFPVLSLAFTILLFRHHFLITHLGTYIHCGLASFLRVTAAETAASVSDAAIPGSLIAPAAPSQPPHWDAWLRLEHAQENSPKSELRTILWFELIGAWLLLWVSALLATIALSLTGASGRLFLAVDDLCLAAAFYPYGKEALRIRRLFHR